MMFFLVDMDHTLSDAYWRDDLLGNWDRYHRAAADDEPIAEMVSLLWAIHAQGWRIIILTARPSKYRAMTEQWLRDNNVPFDEILMRDDEGFHPSDEMKWKLVQGRFPNIWEHPIIVMDDRTDVSRKFSENGITVLQVHARKEKAHWVEGIK